MWHGNAKHTENSVSVPRQAVPGSSANLPCQKGQYSSGHEEMNIEAVGEKNKLTAEFKILLPLSAGVVSFNLKSTPSRPFFLL